MSFGKARPCARGRAFLLSAVVLVGGVGVAGGACASDGDDDGGWSGARAGSASSTTSTTAGITAGEQRTSSESTTTTVAQGARADGWPEQVETVEHGGRYWAVYLAVVRGSDGNAPKLLDATRQAAAVGYETGSGDVGCDTGAKEALKLDPSIAYSGVAIYFETEAAARKFVELYEPGVVGVASVETLCAD